MLGTGCSCVSLVLITEGDSDVDLDDYKLFAPHVNGPMLPGQGTGWQKADFNGDGHVDLKDFLVFQKSFGGPNQPPRAYTSPAPMIYTWDAENRLISAAPQVAGEGAKKVAFEYDYLGRRVRKTVWTHASSQWVEDAGGDQAFVYDGWNVVLVLDANAGNATLRKYTWGLDLAGSLQGAGGIGGLLAVEETTGTHQGSYWFCYDGNGNVGQLLRATDQSVVARYEYDPYGNTIVAEGAYANTNPFHFSTKWFDLNSFS